MQSKNPLLNHLGLSWNQCNYYDRSLQVRQDLSSSKARPPKSSSHFTRKSAVKITPYSLLHTDTDTDDSAFFSPFIFLTQPLRSFNTLFEPNSVWNPRRVLRGVRYCTVEASRPWCGMSRGCVSELRLKVML
jgi:hypothetical protein